VELALNLLWAGIAATLLGLWTAPGFAHKKKRGAGIALLALLCVICVLFPIVSMTDDLSASPADPETLKSKLGLQPHFPAGSGIWMLVYDPHQTAFRHEVDLQSDSGPTAHSFIPFLLTRRPPPQAA
jgi:hypothetical protein